MTKKRIQKEKPETSRLDRLFEDFILNPRQAHDQLLAHRPGRNMRQSHRISCRCSSSYISHGVRYNDVIRNLSIGGAFIETRTAPCLDPEILLTFSMPEFKQPIEVRAKIAWVGHHGFGVEFKLQECLCERGWAR